MNLVMFDIDGTLADSNSIDSACFSESLRHHLNLDELDTDWDSYSAETDSGLACEVASKFLGRPLTFQELAEIESTFCLFLKNRFSKDHSCCSPITGANAFIDALYSSKNTAIAFATAGWRQTALLKLDHVKIDLRDNILKTSSEHSRKIDAMASARTETAIKYSLDSFTSSVYIGDSWRDYRFASELQMKFIGIGPVFHNANTHFPAFPDFCRVGDILNHLNAAQQGAAANP